MSAFYKYIKAFIPAVWPQFLVAIVCGALYGASSGLGIPATLKWVYPRIFEQHGQLSLRAVLLVCAIPVMVAFIRGISWILNAYYLAFCGQHILEGIRVRVFEKIQQLPLSYFQKKTPGDLIARVTADTSALQTVLIEFSQDILKQPATLIGAMAYLCYLCFQRSDVFFLLVYAIALPLCLIPIRFMGKKLKEKAQQAQWQVGEITQRLTQNLSAIKEIRSFCLESRELQRFAQTCAEMSRRFLKTVKYTVSLSPVIEMFSSFGVGLALFYAYKKQIPPEDLITTALALYMCYEPVKKLGRLHNLLQTGLVSLERIEEVIREPLDIADPEHPFHLDCVKGEIIFDHVTFAYEGEPVLVDITLELAARKTYALVGSSGAGKSTFASLIPRFFQPQSGAIFLDGIDIRGLRLKDLRGSIAVVSQDPVLFSDTVYNNLLVGNPAATRAQVEAAAKNAFAHEFITELEKGYDTELGENGVRLSGGQKQRMAIARAFLKAAPILILDEATSALDAHSEHFIQQALANLMSGRTVLIIAHRFSSIAHADEILVFDRGSLVERGPHNELYAKGGIYHALYEKQMGQQPS